MSTSEMQSEIVFLRDQVRHYVRQLETYQNQMQTYEKQIQTYENQLQSKNEEIQRLQNQGAPAPNRHRVLYEPAPYGC